ncbi:MAG: FIST C-terminal domain-containing protein [Clostridia bacterium]|nr:FIST C-terminal domain-containing protein [Clostridia bacterium]
MTKFFTAFTTEIDDTEAAVREICEQLKPQENSLKDTIGIVYFYYEYVEMDVCQAIIDALPFEIVGCVSTYIATNKQYADVALSVTMITSDDAYFAVKTLEGLDTKSKEQIADEITQVLADFSAPVAPKIVMPFLAPLPHFSGDELVAVANALPKPLPLFGTVAFNMETTEGNHFVVGSGKISTSTFAFVAFYGNIEPKCHITSSFAFDEGVSDSAEITEADGPVLKALNGMPAVEYLKKLGIITHENSVAGSGIWAVPAILIYPNGTKTVRAFLGILKGTEYIFATGAMEEGAKVMFGYLNGEKTIASAEQLMKEITANKENDILAYSCAARAWSLGVKFFAEAQTLAKCATEYERVNNATFHYSVTYSGGEICPVYDNEGNLINCLHNYTFIACAFNRLS